MYGGGLMLLGCYWNGKISQTLSGGFTMEAAMAPRTSSVHFFDWTWSAVLAGVFTSLVVQILLVMLGFGLGLLTVDVPTADAAPATTGHIAFAWWAVSGILAAFAGGAVAAANAPDQSDAGRVGHALATWAVAVVVVVGVSALSAGSAANMASNLAGPSYAAAARIGTLTPARETTGQAARRAPTQAQIEQARRHFAYAMIASFFALLLGAGAAYAAGISVDARTARQLSDAAT
jgi:hypothetical protein